VLVRSSFVGGRRGKREKESSPEPRSPGAPVEREGERERERESVFCPSEMPSDSRATTGPLSGCG